MKNCKKLLSTVLCFIIIATVFAVVPVSALSYPAMAEISSSSGSASIYSLPGTYGHETEGNKNQSQFLCSLTNGTQVKVLGLEKDGDGDPWYKINYGEGFAKSGYAYASRVLVKYEYSFDEDFEENLKNFPESYHSALRELHAKYPNWRFVANELDLSFKQAVEVQYGVSDVTKTRKWVEFSYGGNEWRDLRGYNKANDTWATLESRWTYASREAIEYFMDPRNSLNEDMIFAFMQQSYQEDANMKENLRAVIKGTFLEKGYDKNGDGTAEKDAYVEDIITAAQQSRVSPYVLAATIIVEQGVKGESALISGTYSGFVGYYNFFNFSAAGANTQAIIENGLAYAKQSGWNSRTAAIVGGAKKYADGYISVGQDTYYYKDFNVVKQDWSHQYASALYDAWTNANYLKKGCITNTNTALTFSIPVYKDMPQVVCVNPSDMVESQVQENGIAITAKKTGVYTISCMNYQTQVFDKNGNKVAYSQSKQGWPLVAEQKYTVRLNGYDGDYSQITVSIQKTADTIFSDTYKGEWYNDAVTYAVGAGIITGYGGTTKFGTADSIQRQDFLVMLARFDGVDLTSYGNKKSEFPDVPEGSYYEAAINWAYSEGITTGYTDGSGKFGVGDKMTREQIVTFLYRYANEIGVDTTVDEQTAAETIAQYGDFAKVSDFAEDAIVWALANGVISGQGGKAIDPQGGAQRCQIAQIMYNIYLNDIF